MSELLLRGPTLVIIDWANVYGWRKELKTDPDPILIWQYLQQYSEIKECRFYYGTDINPQSKAFIEKIGKLGYAVITKPVKYLIVQKQPRIVRRKCDFDLEIGVDVWERKNEYESFIFFSGDGDFAYLYRRLTNLSKKIIVVTTSGHLGREVWELGNKVYRISYKKLL